MFRADVAAIAAGVKATLERGANPRNAPEYIKAHHDGVVDTAMAIARQIKAQHSDFNEASFYQMCGLT